MIRPCVYILASCRHGTLYIGVTGDVAKRVYEHKVGAGSEFTKRHDVTHLVHVEFHATMEDAILREKRMKKWRRAWKINLIERGNPRWRDLSDDLT